ncbi:toxin-antitoxin system HicB family antitoxin [Salmonella enterica subsp. enterica]|nr:toxin-antitoxin system HicB family antitoxin [Salmonella enterica subsp. enterica serovar Amherstiana]
MLTSVTPEPHEQPPILAVFLFTASTNQPAAQLALQCVTGRISLAEYRETRQEEGIAPFNDDDKIKSFTLRYPGWMEVRLTAAASRAVSKNQFIVQLLERELQ